MSSRALRLLEPGRLLGGALFQSLLAGQAEQDDGLAPGTRLGVFRIVRKIGAGGMGVVYLAERDDGQYQQQVAIKCVSQSGGDSSLFRRERQILAQMRHPHIARLIDGGETAGTLWFAMELIEGVRIDEHARTAELSVPARIRRLLEVCDAISFAHERLLLHRDLKPANVLIDSDGRVKLLDFGIAALVGDVEASRAYSPAWASPEQRAGEDVGPASDQYQLGLLLNVMLRADCRSAAPGEIDPQLWLAIPPARRAELTAILLRATAAAATARYSSVAALRDDLVAWLAHRPVAAFAGGWAYALRTLLRRNPFASAAAAIGSLLLVAIVVFFNLRLKDERDRAQAEAERATRAAETATSISRFLQDDVFAFADPNTSQDVDFKVGALLKRAEASLGTRLADRPAIAAELLITIGRSQRGLGDLDAAQRSFAAAKMRLENLADANLQLQWHLWHGELLLARSQTADAIDDLQQALTIAQALGETHPLYLEAAVRLAVARFDQTQGAAAVSELSALLPKIEATLGQDAPLTIFALNRLAIMLNSIERVTEAETVRSEHLLRAQRAYGAEHSTTLTGRLNRAVLLRKLGRLDEAAAEAARASAGLRKVFGHPSIASLHAQNVESNILRDSGRLDAAIALQEQTLAARIELLGEVHDDVAFSLSNLAGSLTIQSRYSEASAHLQRALAIRAQLYPADHVDLITNLSTLADVERLRGRLAIAEAYASDAVARATSGLAADRPERGNAWYRYAQVLQAIGKADAAKSAAESARAVLIRHYPPSHPRIVAIDALLRG